MLRCLPRAEELGYESVFQVSHHVQPDGLCPSPLIAMAGAAAVTERMRIATGCLLVPLYAPLKLAEDVAVLDCLSNGRFVFGVAPGYVSEEFAAHGVPREERVGALLGGARPAAAGLDAGVVLVRGPLLPGPRDERDAQADPVAAARLVRPLGAAARSPAPPAAGGVLMPSPRHGIAEIREHVETWRAAGGAGGRAARDARGLRRRDDREGRGACGAGRHVPLPRALRQEVRRGRARAARRQRQGRSMRRSRSTSTTSRRAT